jgi:adenylate cyclase
VPGAGTAPSTASLRVAEGADAEERRLVTSLFADVSGFTTLADRLEPDELHEIIAPVIAELAAIGDKYEGFIAKYAGDALLIFFGAPIAHEDDPTRALLTALEMHEQLPAIASKLPPDAQGLSLHIGVNTGRVISGRYGGESRSDYSILGDAVILAQRLESVSSGGETFVGPTTYELTKHEFRFESLGELQLKGKLRPVQAYKLLGRRRSVAISGTALDRPRLPLVGRDDELGVVWSVLDRLAAGRGGLVAVSAEPGVGKSRLLREVREQAGEAGVRWYQGRCVSYGSGLPYHPYVDLLRQVTGIRPEDDPVVGLGRLEAALEGAADDALPYFASLLGLSGGSPASGEGGEMAPEAFRRGLHGGMRSWLETLAGQSPVVFALEDLHWADSASVALTVELQSLGAAAPVAFVATARPEGSEVLAALAGAAGDTARTIDLKPLDAAAMRALLAALLGTTPPIELSAVVSERAQGNPLFVEEMVRSLQESGDLYEIQGRWRLKAGWDSSAVPETVERVLASRIDRLPPSETAVLQQAAVVGRVVPISFAELLLADVEDAAASLDRLVSRGLLDRTVFIGEPAVMFSHALVQEVAYDRLLKRVRRELHLKVADIAEARWGDGEEAIDLLARQLYLGEAGDRAVAALVKAGQRAKRLYANETAIEHLRRAVEISADSPESARISLDLAELEELVGHFDAAEAAYLAARAAGDVRAWAGIASVHRKRGQYDLAVETVDEALREQRWASYDRALLVLERSSALFSQGLPEVVEDLTAALAELEAVEHPVKGRILLMLARGEQALNRVELAESHAAAAMELFERTGDLPALTASLRLLGGVAAARGDVVAAVERLRGALSYADRVGSAEEKAACLLNLGWALEQMGQLADAIDCDREAIAAFGEAGHESGRANAEVNLAAHLLLSERFDEAIQQAEHCVTVGREIGFEAVTAEALETLAAALLKQDRLDDGCLRAAEAAEAFLAFGQHHRAAAVLEAAAAAVESSDAERARALAARARSALEGAAV